MLNSGERITWKGIRKYTQLNQNDYFGATDVKAAVQNYVLMSRHIVTMSDFKSNAAPAICYFLCKPFMYAAALFQSA